MVKILIMVIMYVQTGYCLQLPPLNPLDSSKNETSKAPTFFLVETSPGVFKQESLVSEPKYNANDSDVLYYFYSRKFREGILIYDDNGLSKTDFSNTKPTIFIIHGWQNNLNSSVNVLVREAYLSMVDVNVIVVDWSKIAEYDYVTAQFNVKKIGDMVGTFLKYLEEHAGLNLRNTGIVGHSLGAHVAGVAGHKAGGMIDLIIGLDPAGPLFLLAVKVNRLDLSSAQFVQVIHTNAGELGFVSSLGTADYWCNGGTTQPGCLSLDGSCSHSRSYIYFAESIKTGNFLAKSCKLWVWYLKGQCDENPSSWMGQINVDKSAKGNYDLYTNDKPLYAKG